MKKRIICKVHDENKVVTKVGIEGQGTFPIMAVWNDIMGKIYEFYTFEAGKEAKVHARQIGATKYLTTHPDGVTPNNLDELPRCGL